MAQENAKQVGATLTSNVFSGVFYTFTYFGKANGKNLKVSTIKDKCINNLPQKFTSTNLSIPSFVEAIHANTFHQVRFASKFFTSLLTCETVR